MVLLYAAVGRNAGASGRPLAATGWFVAGYLSAWIAFSLAATGAQWTLTRLALLTPMMESASGIFGGIVLIAAGLYQWSLSKDTCLLEASVRTRSPRCGWERSTVRIVWAVAGF
jgi:predicted metal-binding membrane protein